jgi:hypothetical protein
VAKALVCGRKLPKKGPYISSPNIVTVIKPRDMRWAGHVAGMVEKRNGYRPSVGKSE